MLPTVDVHTHILPASYLKALDDLGIQTEKEDGFPEPHWSEEDHLAFMETTGQSFQVISISSPHPHRGDDRLALAQARLINDETAALCRRHPGKLGFCTYLPLPNVAGSLDEVVRGYDELGALGVKVPSNANGIYLGNPLLAPLYEELDRRSAVVLIHPTAPAAAPQDTFTAELKPMYEFLADTTRSVIDLIMRGVLERYPHIRWVVPHCGSFLPEVAHRMVGISQILVPLQRMEQVDVMGCVRRLYFDVAGTAQPVMLDALLKVTDPTHILYGSDFPYTPVPMIARTKEALERDPLLADCVEDVFAHNAVRLFDLMPSSTM